IEDPVVEIGIRRSRRLDHEQLVAADAEAAMRDAADRIRPERERPGGGVDHDEVVAQAVHLGEAKVKRFVIPLILHAKKSASTGRLLARILVTAIWPANGCIIMAGR